MGQGEVGGGNQHRGTGKPSSLTSRGSMAWEASFGPKIKCMRTRPHHKWGQAELEVSSSKEDPSMPSPRPGLENSTHSSHWHTHIMTGLAQKYLPLQCHVPSLPCCFVLSALSMSSPFPEEQGMGCSSGERWALRTTSCRASCWSPGAG